MGGVGKALDPTGNNFLGLGNTVGRGLGDVFTGGLAEFGRPDSFGIPSKYATPLKIAGGAIGGGLLGSALGPGGGMVGSTLGGTLGGMLGGNVGAGVAGGAGAGILQQLLGGGGGGGGSGGGGLGGLGNTIAGGSLLGLGLSMNPSVGNVQMPSNAADQAAIKAEEGSLQNLFGQQNQQYGQLADAQRQNLLRQLDPSQPLGQQFMGEFNNYGITPQSGAFQTGLANQFGNLAAQQQQDILGMNINQTGQLANLDQSGLSRQFGLEDQQSQFNIAQAVQNAQMQQQKQNALLGGGSYILGGGLSGMGGGGAGGGGIAGGGGAAGGGGGGNSISNLVQSLMGGIGTIGNNLQGLFGIGGSGPSTGDPNLDLYSGGNPFLQPKPMEQGGMNSGVMQYPGAQQTPANNDPLALSNFFAPGQTVTPQSMMQNPNIFPNQQGMMQLPGMNIDTLPWSQYQGLLGKGSIQPMGANGNGYLDPATGQWVPLNFA